MRSTPIILNTLGMPVNIVAYSNVNLIKVISTYSTVGEVHACKLDGKEYALKLFMLGNAGLEDDFKMNNRRDYLLQEFPYYLALSAHPAFVKIHGVVTDNGKVDGKFVGLTMEYLDTYQTFASFSKQAEKISAEVIIDLLKQYLDALAFMHSMGLKSKTEHADNIMLNAEMKIKIIDIDEIAICPLNVERDLHECEFIFKPLLNLCDDLRVKSLFEDLAKYKSIKDCMHAIDLIFPDLPWVSAEYSPNLNYISLQQQLRRFSDKCFRENLARSEQRERENIAALQERLKKYEKLNPSVQAAYKLLIRNNLSVFTPSADLEGFLKTYPLEQWRSLSEDQISQFFKTTILQRRFKGLQKGLIP